MYFPPEVVQCGQHEFVFVDGGITTYNNPAFQSFLMATVEPYKMNWQVGEDKMLFGSDWPMIAPEKWLDAFDKAPFKDEVRPLILRENAMRLLGVSTVDKSAKH